MGRCALVFGDECVGGLLDAVVEELVRVAKAQDESPTDSFPEVGVHPLL